MFCGTDNILQNIPHIQFEHEEHSTEYYCESHITLLWIWIMLRWQFELNPGHLPPKSPYGFPDFPLDFSRYQSSPPMAFFLVQSLWILAAELTRGFMEKASKLLSYDHTLTLQVGKCWVSIPQSAQELVVMMSQASQFMLTTPSI